VMARSLSLPDLVDKAKAAIEYVNAYAEGEVQREEARNSAPSVPEVPAFQPGAWEVGRLNNFVSFC
jgi:hypothetical protein